MVNLCFSVLLLFFGGMGKDDRCSCGVAWRLSGADQCAARIEFELETALEDSV